MAPSCSWSGGGSQQSTSPTSYRYPPARDSYADTSLGKWPPSSVKTLVGKSCARRTVQCFVVCLFIVFVLPLVCLLFVYCSVCLFIVFSSTPCLFIVSFLFVYCSAIIVYCFVFRSMDPLMPSSGSGMLYISNSPLDLSPSNNNASSQSPRTPRSQPVPSSDYHPSRRNSLSRRAMQQLSPATATANNSSNSTAIGNSLQLPRPMTASPPNLKRAGSIPLSMRNAAAPSPQHFQRGPVDTAERARISLRVCGGT